MIKLNINGLEVCGHEGQTILDIARENGIDIPTLCHDERVEMYGSCGLCVVEAEGNPKLLRACSSYATDGMIIDTNSKRVRQNRKTALELLLSDHTGDCRPPCVLACPAGTDCQGYAGLIANGEYAEALKLIKEKIPLPSSIGRVCPHPCEEACRRAHVEEPVAIAALKQFAGDLGLGVVTEPGYSTGKRVAIIGGGPGGLSAAYYLRLTGHEVTVFDAMPQMGGMLRYGIPEYRLPKKVLQAEIDSIEKMGVEFRNNIKIGRDLTLGYLRGAYNAVIIAIGAWTGTGLRCPGEDLEGVLGGIDFLRDVAQNKPVYTGGRAAVVGGGNTAMDACRTLVRLGVPEVYNIYRRGRDEMPAEEIEITEAEEEGVIFRNLTNPIEILGADGKVKAVRLQIMELGEPDESGRRAPVPVVGKEELLEVDTVIMAIGQKPSVEGFDDIDMTRWGTIYADEHSFRTNLEGVFAIGDATNKGADIAISAIGEAQKASEMVNKYLNGEKLEYNSGQFLVKTDKTDFADITSEARLETKKRCPSERRNDFSEINSPVSEEDAKKEASRCLECGCQEYFQCKLIDYANRYKVAPEKYEGTVHQRNQKDNHPLISRDPDKCILCGLCVRICDEVVGASALGLVSRGFDTIVKPALDMDLCDTECISCGLCADICPTGALSLKKMIAKQVPLRENTIETTCAHCSVGCKTLISGSGDLLLKASPSSEKDSLLCGNARFGVPKSERLIVPMIRKGGGFERLAFEEAFIYANKSFQRIAARSGTDSIAVAVSATRTNEEALLIKEYALNVLGCNNIYSTAIPEGSLISSPSLEEMENTELIVVINHDIYKNHAVAAMRIKRAVNKGAKLLLISAGGESLFDSFAALKLDCGLEALPQILKALLEKGVKTELLKDLEFVVKDITVSEAALKATEMIAKASKAVFVFEGTALNAREARLISDIALLSGHSMKPRNGIIQLLPGANARGLYDLGVKSGKELAEAIENGKIHALFSFGENLHGIDLNKLEFLAVQDLIMTETALHANLIFPASDFTEQNGTYTGTDGMLRELRQVVKGPVSGQENSEQIKGLLSVRK